MSFLLLPEKKHVKERIDREKSLIRDISQVIAKGSRNKCSSVSGPTTKALPPLELSGRTANRRTYFAASLNKCSFLQ